jgi:Leucine-rich repeat (LRR) protein
LLSRKRTSVAPSLEALDISNNNIKSGNGSLDALKEMSELKSINLDDNYLDDMKELIDIIQTLPKLRYICAVENDFSEEDEKLLEDYCEQNDIDCEI